LQLAHIVEIGEDDKRKPLFDQIMPTFREEYTDGDEDFLALYDFIEDMLIDSILTMKAGFREKLLELSPLIRAMQKAATVMGKIASLFLKAGRLSDEERYYAACLIHAMDVEGQFDEACRLLYVLYKASLGENVKFSEAAGLSVKKLRTIMSQLTACRSDILFLGWQEGHLRNSVAHMRLEYNAAKDEMHFVDMDTDRNVTYDKTLPFKDFSRYFHLANGVSFVFLHLVMILGAHDMAFATDPFQDHSASLATS
jgi:hypothetical protein